MAMFTGIGRGKMTGVSGCGNRAVMTGRTTAADTRMDKIDGNPGSRRMALIAGFGRGKVAGILAGGRLSIMTACARTGYLRVIHGCQNTPAGDRMTGLTEIAGRNMTVTFRRGEHTIVAARTTAVDARMDETGGNPPYSRVALVAGLSGGKVADTLAGGRFTVMTAHAGPQNLIVIHGDDRKPS